jgi:uncharacterized protein (TIGR02246 family)
MCDRWFVLSSLVVTLMFSAGSAAVAQPPGTPQEAEVSPDQQEIEAAAVKFLEAWHARDAEALAALFGPDARMEDVDGEVLEGRDAIQEAYAAEFEANPDAALSISLDSIRLITPDVAIEEGSADYYPDGETLTSRARYIVAHLKKDGIWRIISSRTLEHEVLSTYEYLHDLEWLVGDWIDEGADGVIEFSYSWDENKSYLLNDFRVIEHGEITLTGTQRIGWDPRTKQVRAWIFDTSGGFGEAVWTSTEDGWVVKASGVSPDGIPSSATRKFELLDYDHVVVRTTDRVSGNEQLPDFDVTMVRKPPTAAVAETPQE